MEHYVDLNTEKRKAAGNKFEEDFFKLMTNSAYGKTCEGKRNRIQVKVAQTENQLEKQLNKKFIKSVKVIDEDLVTVSSKQSIILLNKPTIVGAVILDLAKMFMYTFHFDIMKEKLDCTLLYSDTDSLVYEIRSSDVFDEYSKLKDHFDFSNYPKNSPLFNLDHKREVLKFRDETAGDVIKEFCGLKAKQYSIITKS